MRLVPVIVALGSCLAASPAWSCSLRNWNAYEDFGRPPGADLLARSATVDWIAVESPPPALCPREPDGFTDPDIYDDDAAWERIPEECQDPVDRRISPVYVGSVIERLKGRSPDRFVMERYVSPRRSESEPNGEWIGGYWQPFSDLRHTAATAHIAVSMSERSTAEGRHHDLAFWDGGQIEFSLDGSDSCGGAPTLDPEMRYIVFRDEMGAVLALEPVLHGDDAFLHRLRNHADEPEAFTVTPYPVAELFRSASALIQADVLDCVGETGALASYESEKATVRVTGGVQTSVERLFWRAKEQPDAMEFAFNNLWDFYQTRGEICPTGQAILLLAVPMSGPPIWSGATDWTEKNFPGWLAAAAARLHDPEEEDEITPLEVVLADPLPMVGQPRPIQIHEGRIRLADIPTGLTLTGPEWITVEQAFAWFEEGRAAATLAPSSS